MFFHLFDKRLNFSIEVDGEAKKVPVVFAAGERFALTRRSANFRDVNNTLILPIISIERGTIDYSPGLGTYGTPIATRDQISYTVKRRLDSADRDYQNIINKKRINFFYYVVNITCSMKKNIIWQSINYWSLFCDITWSRNR